MTRLRARLRALLHLDDPPPRIALALAVGVFISCTPLLGAQTVLSFLVAVVFRLNRAATITGTWLNLPWFVPLVYGAALKIGTLLIPDPTGVRSAWLAYVIEHPRAVAWRDIPVLLREVSAALIIGTTVVGAVAAAVTYVVALVVITRRRRAVS
ncbi:MAG: DUF2062 domain-containing protein [Candidatus Rokubacteria bacterium]|nr:DUF2062 domain-containing protein [Candidatus Rokubacteria bacterium]